MSHSPLYQLRKEKGFTIAELAKALKTKPGVIGKVEAGKIRFPLVFCDPLEKMGYDALQFLTAQEDFREWLKKQRH